MSRNVNSSADRSIRWRNIGSSRYESYQAIRGEIEVNIQVNTQAQWVKVKDATCSLTFSRNLSLRIAGADTCDNMGTISLFCRKANGTGIINFSGEEITQSRINRESRECSAQSGTNCEACIGRKLVSATISL